MKKVIIIEDSPTFCNMLGKKLETKGWKTILCYNYRDGLKAVKESSEWNVVISDMRLGNDNGIDLLEWMRSNGYQNPFIIMTSYDESMSAVRTMKLGAEDYIPKKLLLDVVYERLEEIIDKQKRLVELNNKIVYRKSEKFRRIYKMAELFAKSDMAVMILGDNGTGKEHIAEKIHLQSKRADKPFEVVDCSEEGENLIWNELGFDVCNTALWSDEAFAYDESNIYNTFFRVKPYEVLNELAENDAIGTVYTTKNSPTLNDYMCTTTLNNVLEDGMDVEEALQDAQDYLDFECE